MSEDRLRGHRAAMSSFRLSVLRVKPGQKFILRMLSENVRGFFTHYVRGRSYYCPGRDCTCQHSRIMRVWKGYLAAEQYEQRQNLWLPQVLEVTEFLELDFRGRFKRGQVWSIERLTEKKGHTNPVTGKLLEERDERTFPPPHRILDTLLHLYHEASLELIYTNPMPDRTFVTPSEGDAPAHLADPAKQVNAEEVKEALNRLREKTSANGNGQPH